MQAITIQYKSGANGCVYLSAAAGAGRTREARNYSKDVAEQSMDMACRYADKLGWLGDRCGLIQGCDYRGDYVHVLVCHPELKN